MKIVTVNVPENYVSAINKIVGKDGLYPSRSEFVRTAVQNFLRKEFKLAENMQKWKVNTPEVEEFDDKNFVRIPIISKDENDEPITEFKTYKILREA